MLLKILPLTVTHTSHFDKRVLSQSSTCRAKHLSDAVTENFSQGEGEDIGADCTPPPHMSRTDMRTRKPPHTRMLICDRSHEK